jgi:hypothetical protein
MIEQLEQLSLALSQISRGQARRVADALNAKILSLVHAQVIKLYWTSEAEEGVLLTPMAFINQTKEPDPRPFQIAPDQKGILSWVFLTRKPVWLEELRSKDLTMAVPNEATNEPVPPDYLDMASAQWADSMMVVPLTMRGEVRGVYSVELRTSGRLKASMLDLLIRVARPLAAIYWDADVYEYNEQRTFNAVSQFMNVTASFSFDEVLLEGEQRSGFIARPFDSQFSDVEARIVSFLESRRIRARAYQPEGGRTYIIDEIQRQIRNSHFCVADLTGVNPNVLAEVGMMMVLRKHFLLLRRRGDAATVPFDLTHLPLYDYETRPGDPGLHIWSVAENRFQPLDVVLQRFIDQLPAESGFSSAPEWTR